LPSHEAGALVGKKLLRQVENQSGVEQVSVGSGLPHEITLEYPAPEKPEQVTFIFSKLGFNTRFCPHNEQDKRSNRKKMVILCMAISEVK
jgi:hypothetical protein